MRSDPVPGTADAATSATPSLSVDRRRALRHLELAAHLAWVVPALAFLVVAALLYAREMAEGELTVERASRIAQEQALKLFETNAMLLQRMLDMWGQQSDEQVLMHGAELHERLKAMAAPLPQVQGLFIIGADARTLATSLVYPPPRQIDYADREFFPVHRAGVVPVFFTEQLRSRISGEPFFDMSVRRTLADGAFGGSVHVSLRPAYLTAFYAELERTEPGLRFAVVKADGRFVARWPDPVPPDAALPAADPLRARMAARAPIGRLDGPSPVDGVARLRTFRRLDPYPVYVVASLGVASIRAQWAREIALLTLFALPATLTLAWMARIALARTRRELVAAQRLDDETALRQRVELALLQSQKLEALGRLTGGVAHDFNNLLMVVASNLFVHRRLVPEAARSTQLAAIERAVSSGTQLTRQLLAFARRQALVPEEIDLAERLPQLLTLLAPMLGRGIAVSGQVDDDVPRVRADPAELELAIINVAVNAKDAMPNGGRFDVRVRRGAADETGLPPAPAAGWTVIEAADSGTGIDAAIADRVFEPFFTTKPVGHGTGLGLSQVKAFCDGAGGAVRIQPRSGGGTRVLLVLPALGEPAPVAGDASMGDAALSLSGTALLVEDNDEVARATQAVLEMLGLRTQRARGADEALAVLDALPGRHDIVVSDIEMPGRMDGIALAEHLRTSHPGLPVLLLTGYAARLQQAVDQRYEVLPKPVPPSLLAQTLTRLLPRLAESPESIG